MRDAPNHEEAVEVARALLSDHFDQVTTQIQTTGDSLIDKAVEIMEKDGFSVDSVSLEDPLNVVILSRKGSDSLSIGSFSGISYLFNNRRNSYQYISTFVDKKLGLGILDNLPSLEKNI